MSVIEKSPAVALAIAHAEAWSNHKWDKAREMLAADVHVLATSTQPGLPNTDTTGADIYMEGLIQFAQAIRPGTLRVLSSVGDAHNSLILLTVKVRFAPDSPEMTLAGGRLALFDDGNKLKDEKVVFFVAPD